MSPYQSFPEEPGDSGSFAKLAALALPPLAGLSFLDVGCNEGFFCGYAMFDAAVRVVGIDRDPEWIARARARFPQCTFLASDWSVLAPDAEGEADGEGPLKPDARFDVILCASALQYAADQPALVAAMVGRLAAGGLLVLEMGVAGPENRADGTEETGPGGEPGSGWLTVRRSIDSRRFPTWAGVRAMLAPYAWKHMGPSVSQPGDPVGREVFHVRRARPFAVLLLGAPGSGKSTAARRLFPGVRLISGDALWALARASADVGEELHAVAASQSDWLRLDKLTRRIFEGDLWRDYVALAVREAGGRDFVFDGYIPVDSHERFAQALEELGYVPLPLKTPDPAYTPYELSRRGRVESHKYQLFLSACAAVRGRRR
ncbi:MAG: methyltransferase domain-containing protein [Desulfovibrio sp.]|nr:methyltransferase domain-containing protein [Desulfovibrio sp.]